MNNILITILITTVMLTNSVSTEVKQNIVKEILDQKQIKISAAGNRITQVDLILEPSMAAYDFKKIKPSSKLMLVNRYNLLLKGYSPKKMIAIQNRYITVKGTQRLNPEVAEALYELNAEAKRQGISTLWANSGYRSITEQAYLFNYRLQINKKAKVKDPMYETQKKVALPGASEHHTGFAVDILSINHPSAASFTGSREAKWLGKNAWRFGFIVRYPDGKQDKHFTMYEPWHLRYVGKEKAEVLTSYNLVLEEYHDILKNSGYLSYKLKDGRKYMDIYTENLAFLKISKSLVKEINHATSGAGYIVTIEIPQDQKVAKK